VKKYFIYTFGCKVNQCETQLIAEKFKKDGFEKALKPEEADVIVFNTCTVTSKADKECEYFLRKSLKLENKPEIILAGCFAKNKQDYAKDAFPEVKVMADKNALFAQSEKQSVKAFDGRSRAFVKIQDGCNSFCSYCIVPYVRNSMWSKPENVVLEEIENLVKSGYPEIVLTGIHVGKYSGGIFPLLEKIMEISLEFRVRISSIELNEIDDALIKLMLKYPDKICRHLHIPLQSGSSEVLKQMNRHYNSVDFEKKVNEILTLMPDLALTSDIITGFPGETEANYRETVNFIERNPFARLHVFSYSDREGTKASEFSDKVAAQEIKRRSKELFEIDAAKRALFLFKNIGQKRRAVAIGNGKALTGNYITVPIPASSVKPSGIFEVIIDKNSVV